jgi:hypothetical protein
MDTSAWQVPSRRYYSPTYGGEPQTRHSRTLIAHFALEAKRAVYEYFVRLSVLSGQDKDCKKNAIALIIRVYTLNPGIRRMFSFVITA